MKILILNGPNINMLGIREPGIYGSESYGELCRLAEEKAKELGVGLEIYQTNHEGCLVDKIQEAYGKIDGIVFNPGAYTHTSIAILDALKAVSIPTVEVHLSDINARESFRQHSFVSLTAIKTIAGFGFEGYKMAIEYLNDYLKK